MIEIEQRYAISFSIKKQLQSKKVFMAMNGTVM